MSTLHLYIHDDAPDWVIRDCMTVMDTAFDPRFGEAWSAAQTRAMMDFPGARLIIARLGDMPVGFALLRSILDEAELMLLAVHAGQRKLGYGQSLLQHTLDVAAQAGCTRCFLEVREGNPAERLYQGAGFTQYRRRNEYYRGHNGEVFNAISYSIDLNPYNFL